MHKFENLQPIFIGGTGRSGTTVLSKFIGSHADVVKIPLESRFIIDKHGLIDLYYSLTQNFSLDQGRISLSNFENKIIKDMANPLKAPYLGWNLGNRLKIKKAFIYEVTRKLINQLSYSRYEGIDYSTSDNFNKKYYLRYVLLPFNRLIGKLSENTINERLTFLEPSLKKLRPKEQIIIPRYFKDNEVLLKYLREFVLDMFLNTFESNTGISKWCEDTPANILNIDFLEKLFPEAKFIHVMRHPAAVVFSMRKIWWAPNTLEKCCDFLEGMYLKHMEIHEKYQNSNNYIFFKLEDLIEKSEKQRLIKFLELDAHSFSGEISIDNDKMNYFKNEIELEDLIYIEKRFKKTLDFYNYDPIIN